jgi:hypothetical protein
MEVNDKAIVKTTKKKMVAGRIQEIGDDHLIIKPYDKRKPDFKTDYPQIIKIKFKENVPGTVLKSATGLIGLIALFAVIDIAINGLDIDPY